MTLVEDKGTGGFSFIWSIHNFSFCVQPFSRYLKSPEFVVKFLGDLDWCLLLYPRGNRSPGFISYELYQSGIGIQLNIDLSVRVSNGVFKNIGIQAFDSEHISVVGYDKFLSLDELLKTGPDSYLDNDTLTLRCRMWRNDTDLLTPIRCYAQTKIKVTKIDYMWTVNDFVDSHNKYIANQSTRVPFYNEIPDFTIHLLSGGTLGDDIIYFAIKQLDHTKQFTLTCVIYLLDANESVVHSIRGKFLFEKSDDKQIWTIPFLSKHNLLSSESVFLPNGKLSLQCEFSASTGDANSTIKKCEYKIVENPNLKGLKRKLVSDISSVWKEDMQCFYKEGKFSDFAIHTSNKVFPIHKAILGAQSAVFRAMFERDMQENQTGIVEIEDLDEDTVFKMLLFLYTNTLADLNFPMAAKLFYAADKYGMRALHGLCSNYLQSHLNTSNACNALVLADTHQDQELKSAVQDFIYDHCLAILNSEDWKKLMDAKPYLTSKTLQWIVCKDLDFPMDAKLFYAADEYGMRALHGLCSNFLQSHLDTSNACNALFLANTHQDQELESTVQDFIYDHCLAILNSDDWKKLKSYLTSKTLQWIVCKGALKT